ncbi:MAG: hypothetical protein D6746_14720 [Bacteroidetes bacterium]|nr:MAG: hypothetical protein D6746_14720 [Bacteroidota bacterium]GIV58438.1 MAG: hypothetical protein KatS3mg042_1351 [Rhodothermaceae bacterium]
MRYDSDTPSDLGDSLATWLFGFFGAVAAFLLLPRALKYFVRRLLVRLVSEAVLLVAAGLLTERIVDWLSRERATPPVGPRR